MPAATFFAIIFFLMIIMLGLDSTVSFVDLLMSPSVVCVVCNEGTRIADYLTMERKNKYNPPVNVGHEPPLHKSNDKNTSAHYAEL